MVAGEAILSGVTTTEFSKTDRGRAESQDEVLEAMVREHSRMVYRIAYAVLHSHHDAEDATQETFVRTLRQGAKLAAIEDPRAWLARVAWRVAVDKSRQRGRGQEVPLDDPDKAVAEPASTDAGVDENLQSAQSSARIEKLIEALPEKLRLPLVLSAVEEMTPREVGSMLGINEAAVRSRIFRARQILKEKLAAFEKKP